ncbi:uncharacterized protein LOC130654215 [Hydractinia symbiolongicarpus]|uniref:uncharacterized protein LOC130654215 n=1 Tax=Hydractinia symbiolongicarpus TaxID=13093 RepID=UPI00254BF8E2|nr:uncharacterized protein LOC130654215 [Hydractinia symbiolongicarpus]
MASLFLSYAVVILLFIKFSQQHMPTYHVYGYLGHLFKYDLITKYDGVCKVSVIKVIDFASGNEKLPAWIFQDEFTDVNLLSGIPNKIGTFKLTVMLFGNDFGSFVKLCKTYFVKISILSHGIYNVLESYINHHNMAVNKNKLSDHYLGCLTSPKVYVLSLIFKSACFVDYRDLHHKGKRLNSHLNTEPDLLQILQHNSSHALYKQLFSLSMHVINSIEDVGDSDYGYIFSWPISCTTASEHQHKLYRRSLHSDFEDATQMKLSQWHLTSGLMRKKRETVEVFFGSISAIVGTPVEETSTVSVLRSFSVLGTSAVTMLSLSIPVSMLSFLQSSSKIPYTSSYGVKSKSFSSSAISVFIQPTSALFSSLYNKLTTSPLIKYSKSIQQSNSSSLAPLDSKKPKSSFRVRPTLLTTLNFTRITSTPTLNSQTVIITTLPESSSTIQRKLSNVSKTLVLHSSTLLFNRITSIPTLNSQTGIIPTQRNNSPTTQRKLSNVSKTLVLASSTSKFTRITSIPKLDSQTVITTTLPESSSAIQRKVSNVSKTLVLPSSTSKFSRNTSIPTLNSQTVIITTLPKKSSTIQRKMSDVSKTLVLPLSTSQFNRITSIPKTAIITTLLKHSPTTQTTVSNVSRTLVLTSTSHVASKDVVTSFLTIKLSSITGMGSVLESTKNIDNTSTFTKATDEVVTVTATRIHFTNKIFPSSQHSTLIYKTVSSMLKHSSTAPTATAVVSTLSSPVFSRTHRKDSHVSSLHITTSSVDSNTPPLSSTSILFTSKSVKPSVTSSSAYYESSTSFSYTSIMSKSSSVIFTFLFPTILNSPVTSSSFFSKKIPSSTLNKGLDTTSSTIRYLTSSSHTTPKLSIKSKFTPTASLISSSNFLHIQTTLFELTSATSMATTSKKTDIVSSIVVSAVDTSTMGTSSIISTKFLPATSSYNIYSVRSSTAFESKSSLLTMSKSTVPYTPSSIHTKSQTASQSSKTISTMRPSDIKTPPHSSIFEKVTTMISLSPFQKTQISQQPKTNSILATSQSNYKTRTKESSTALTSSLKTQLSKHKTSTIYSPSHTDVISSYLISSLKYSSSTKPISCVTVCTTSLNQTRITREASSISQYKSRIAVSSLATIHSYTQSSTIVFTTFKPDSPPQVKNPIGHQFASSGRLFQLRIPNTVFQDYEDGGTRNLSLKANTSIGDLLITSNWLIFNANTQTFTGIPLRQDFDAQGSNGVTITVSAADKSGNIAIDTFNIYIKEPMKSLTFVVFLTLSLDFTTFLKQKNLRVDIINRIARFYGTYESEDLYVSSLEEGSTILGWSNTSLGVNTCARESIGQIMEQVQTPHTNTPSERFSQFLLPEFPLIGVSSEYIGVCVENATASPPVTVPIVQDNKLNYLYYVIPITILGIILLIVLIIVLLFWRRNRKQDVRRYEKGRPALLPDEIELQKLAVQERVFENLPKSYIGPYEKDVVDAVSSISDSSYSSQESIRLPAEPPPAYVQPPPYKPPLFHLNQSEV